VAGCGLPVTVVRAIGSEFVLPDGETEDTVYYIPGGVQRRLVVHCEVHGERMGLYFGNHISENKRPSRAKRRKHKRQPALQ
jgi:hypothetical protein